MSHPADIALTDEHRALVQSVAEAAAAAFGVPLSAVVGRSRYRPVIDARHAAVSTSYRMTELSSTVVAAAFGRNHSTVLHSAKRTQEFLETDPQFRARYEAMQALLGPVNGHGGDGHTGEITQTTQQFKQVGR